MSLEDPPPSPRANDLDGKEWTRNSISVWNDIRKSPEETALKHPAMFPIALVERIIQCFTRESQRVILDPFCGSGSTLIAASCLRGHAIGFEVSPEYVELCRRRLEKLEIQLSVVEDFPEATLPSASGALLYQSDASRIPALLPPESVDLCVTSPPYWNILARRRTADYREVRDYAGGQEDLSRLDRYDEFLDALARIFDGVYEVLRPGGYCVVNVMDLRKKAVFFPLHSDLARRLSDRSCGGRFIFDDLVIWDRRSDYNSLRPLGYPRVFRINKVHEFLLIFRKLSSTDATNPPLTVEHR